MVMTLSEQELIKTVAGICAKQVIAQSMLSGLSKDNFFPFNYRDHNEAYNITTTESLQPCEYKATWNRLASLPRTIAIRLALKNQQETSTGSGNDQGQYGLKKSLGKFSTCLKDVEDCVKKLETVCSHIFDLHDRVERMMGNTDTSKGYEWDYSDLIMALDELRSSKDSLSRDLDELHSLSRRIANTSKVDPLESMKDDIHSRTKSGVMSKNDERILSSYNTRLSGAYWSATSTASLLFKKLNSLFKARDDLAAGLETLAEEENGGRWDAFIQVLEKSWNDLKELKKLPSDM